VPKHQLHLTTVTVRYFTCYRR